VEPGPWIHSCQTRTRAAAGEAPCAGSVAVETNLALLSTWQKTWTSLPGLLSGE